MTETTKSATELMIVAPTLSQSGVMLDLQVSQWAANYLQAGASPEFIVQSMADFLQPQFVAEHRDRVQAGHFDPDIYSRIALNDNTVVAVIDADVCYPDSPFANLGALHVQPAIRHTGIANQLLDGFEASVPAGRIIRAKRLVADHWLGRVLERRGYYEVETGPDNHCESVMKVLMEKSKGEEI